VKIGACNVKYLGDILTLLGCISILIFVYQVWPVGTWLIGGVMLIVISIIFEIGQRVSKK